MRLVTRLGLGVVGFSICAVSLIAQQGKPAQGSSPSPSSSGAPPGLNFPYSTLQQFATPPDDKDDVFLCYALVPVISSSAPFSIQSVSKIDGAVYSGSKTRADGTPIKKPHDAGTPVKCTIVDADHPLESRQRIVLAIDTHLVDLNPARHRIQSLNVNVTFTQGSAISQRAQRPSISAAIQSFNLSTPQIYYLLVTDRLGGDSIPQLSVSLLYDPPEAGQPWSPLTIYPPGSIVFGPKGHFWQTQLGGVSSPLTSDDWKPMLAENVVDPAASATACQWSPYGTSPPSSQTPSLPWTQGTHYTVNSVVFSPSNGLFYLETASFPASADGKPGTCTSGTKSPFGRSLGSYQEIGKGYTTNEAPNVAVQWTWVKIDCDPTSTPVWKPNTLYTVDKQICQPGSPSNLYRSAIAGYSELAAPSFLNPSNTDSAPGSPINTKEYTGQVQWKYVQDSCIPPDSQPPVTNEWHANTYYKLSAEICVSDKLYQVINEGRSAAKPPVFQNPQTQTNLPKWTDIGIYPPSAVTSASATEVETNAISIPLAQVHTLAYYNVDSGVLVSTIRIPSFAYTTPTTVNNGTPVQTGSTLLVDPVVTLTRYIWGFDAESREHLTDWRPGISLSFSLASPTSNFYAGGSSEVLRYIQVEYGFAVAEVPRLTPGSFAPTSSTTPSTHQVFTKGGYVGLSFNLSDFVKNLVKGSS